MKEGFDGVDGRGGGEAVEVGLCSLLGGYKEMGRKRLEVKMSRSDAKEEGKDTNLHDFVLRFLAAFRGLLLELVGLLLDDLTDLVDGLKA